MLSALYAIARPSVRLRPACPSVRPSHEWIRRKRLKLGSCNFHHTVAPSLCFLRYKFHPEIPPERGRQTMVGRGLVGNIYFRSSNAFARRLPKLDILSHLHYFKRILQVAALSRANRGVSCAFLYRQRVLKIGQYFDTCSFDNNSIT